MHPLELWVQSTGQDCFSLNPQEISMFSSPFLEFVLKKQTPETLNTPLVFFVLCVCVCVCAFSCLRG